MQGLVRYDRNDAVSPSASRDAFLSQTEPRSFLLGLPFSNDELRFGFPRKSHGGVVNGDGGSGSGYRLLPQPLTQCSVYDLKGKILALAKDQVGCRFLQERMRSLASPEEVSFVFLELIGNVVELMLDPSGNYVFQKLVEICCEEQRTSIILMVTKPNFQLVNISLDSHGTRAVQKLLEYVTTQEQRNLIMLALCPGIVALTKDSNGLHVIEHCLKLFSNEDNKYILDIVANNCFDIATDRSGCCVMQYCVDHAQGETKERLMNEIIINASLLADDCYGNYVVQHLVSLKIQRTTESILRQLKNKFFSLSCNKYGSNVVEKFFHDSGELYSTQIISELLCNPNVSMLLVDPYGNYVIKSALCVSKGPIRNTLRELVERHYPMMRNNLYGKKLLGWFDKWKLRQM
uniref:Pumilio isogenyy domain family member 4 n=3 Tax=Cajanus cajan TaxID=3821 RepID=A0A151QY57_CAJCA|nr:Pumilio isogenyy domain family member 4 [Cajanus cajan]